MNVDPALALVSLLFLAYGVVGLWQASRRVDQLSQDESVPRRYHHRPQSRIPQPRGGRHRRTPKRSEIHQ